MAIEGKAENSKVLRRVWKTPQGLTSGPGSYHKQEKSWVMMMDRNDKEHGRRKLFHK